MDMLSTTPPSPPSQLNQWPNKPAQRGKFYGVQDPVFKKDQLCVMLMETWVDVGTIIKKNEQVMKAQNGRIVELKAANDSLAAQLRDATERLKNLRRARRKEMREEIEKNLPAEEPVAAPAVSPTKFF